jgi:hypothetical protein
MTLPGIAGSRGVAAGLLAGHYVLAGDINSERAAKTRKFYHEIPV